MKPETVAKILDEIDYEFTREAPPDWFPSLPRVPKSRYFDPDLFKLEMQALRKCWVIVGTIHDFAEAGSYKLIEQWGDAGVIVVRGHDDEIRAFHNVCMHRGAPLVTDKCGVERRLNCKVHSWSYDLDGSLVGVPGRRDFHADLNKQENGLKAVGCEVWRGFVFVSIDPEEPLTDYLGPIADEATWFDGLRTVAETVITLDCNWKTAIEANIEVYHITTVHPETVGLGLDYRGSAHELYSKGHSRMVVPRKGYDAKAARKDVAAEEDAHFGLIKNANVSWLLFPFHLTPSGTPSDGKCGITLQTFWPIGPEKTQLEWRTMMPDWGDGDPPVVPSGANVYFDQVMSEDTEYLESIQKAFHAEAFSGPLLSYHERRLYHHEASVDRLIGVDNVPLEIRIEDLLPTADK